MTHVSRPGHRRTSCTTVDFQDQVQITYASRLYQAGVDIIAVQELLGHSWISTTMRYVHVHATRVEDAIMAGQQRAAQRWEGLIR